MNHTPNNYDSMDELLTPDAFKSKTDNSSSSSSISNLLSQPTNGYYSPNSHVAPSNSNVDLSGGHPPGSVPVDLLSLLAKKDTQSPEARPRSSSIPIPVPVSNSNLSPSSVSPRKNSTSPERWAGAAYMNSPDPTSLPIPAFIGSRDNQSPPMMRPHNAHQRSNSVPRVSTKSFDDASPKFGRHHDPSHQVHTAPSSQANTPTKRSNRRNKPEQRNPSPQTPNPPSPTKKESKQQLFILEARKRSAQNQVNSTTPDRNRPNLTNGNVKIMARTQEVKPSPPTNENAPNQTYDNMSNNLKMMLNICSA